jgi:hypothetical protein
MDIQQLHSKAVQFIECGSFDDARSSLVSVLRNLKSFSTSSDSSSMLISNTTTSRSVQVSEQNKSCCDVFAMEYEEEEEEEEKKEKPVVVAAGPASSSKNNNYFVYYSNTSKGCPGTTSCDESIALSSVFTGAMQIHDQDDKGQARPLDVVSCTAIAVYNLALSHHLHALTSYESSSSSCDVLLLKALQLYEKCLLVLEMTETGMYNDDSETGCTADDDDDDAGSCFDVVCLDLLRAATYNNLGQIYRDIYGDKEKATIAFQCLNNILLLIEDEYIQYDIIPTDDAEFLMQAFTASHLSMVMIASTPCVCAGAA